MWFTCRHLIIPANLRFVMKKTTIWKPMRFRLTSRRRRSWRSSQAPGRPNVSSMTISCTIVIAHTATKSIGGVITIRGRFYFSPPSQFFSFSWRNLRTCRKKKEERCRARCLVSGGKIVSLTGGKHNHAPHTEKIQKIFKKEKERSKNP